MHSPKERTGWVAALGNFIYGVRKFIWKETKILMNKIILVLVLEILFRGFQE